jgi:hypothetical protein
MEEVKNRIIELDLQNALLKGISDPAKIMRYLSNILNNDAILRSILLRHFDLNTAKPIPMTDLSLKEKSMLQLMNILFAVEGLLAGIVNLIIYALIVNKHDDIYNPYNHKFASSFEDIPDIELSVKLKFLAKHGFEFLSEICPRDIRNMVAHNDFIIQEDGTIERVKKGTSVYSREQLYDALLKMNEMIMMITDVWSNIGE